MGVIFPLSTAYLPEIQSAIANEPGPLKATAFSQDGKTELDQGALLVVNNQADPGSGTVQLKAQFPNEKRQLWPGAFDAIQQGPQGPIVYVIGQDKKVSIRPVSMRQSLAGEALIDKGLSAGETVVVRGQYRLSPGTLVTLADPNNPSAVPNPTTAGAGMLP